MRGLIVGTGVIGTVYGAHLGDSGHTVSVLNHPPSTDHIATDGLVAHDVRTGRRIHAQVEVVPDAAAGSYDLVLAAVRNDQLASACARLTNLSGAPSVLFFGNNPDGRSAIPATIPGQIHLGFPGVGGMMRDGVAEYMAIKQQPTALPVTNDPRLAELERTLRQRGLSVQRVTDMDGWLAYHAAFVACVCAALYRCGTDATMLGADRKTLTLMCSAVTEAFTALREIGVTGLPRNLAILHNAVLKPVAVRYWGRAMRSPVGELCFAAHARHARSEMEALGDQVIDRLGSSAVPSHLFQLLRGSSHLGRRPRLLVTCCSKNGRCRQ